MARQEDAGVAAGKEAVPTGITEEDIRLGKRASRRVELISWEERNRNPNADRHASCPRHARWLPA